MKLENSAGQNIRMGGIGGASDEKKSAQITMKEGKLDNVEYDTAISETGYGRYNTLLIVAAICPLASSLFSTSTISFILPSAECELELTNFRKGILNAIVYIAMISTAFVWGFLSDTFGRQRLLVVGYGLDAAFSIAAGLAQGYWSLFAAKILTGLICAGPYAVIMTYLAECNPDKYRASVVQWSGLLTAFGTISLPALAWAILPLEIHPNWLAAGWDLPSWRVFLLLSSIPSIISAVTFYYRWESPKFLVSKGRDTEALEILRKMYAINTGYPEDTYPINSLYMEKKPLDTNTEQKSVFRAFLAGFKQLGPLFRPPYLSRALLIFSFQFGALLGYNTVRLWMPQLFASILSAEKSPNPIEASSVCDLLSSTSTNTTDAVVSDDETPLTCLVTADVDTTVYINSIIIGLVTGILFIATSFITRCITDKTLILISTLLSVATSIAMYWGVSSTLMLVFSSLNVSATSISSTAILSVAMVLFPTETRTMAVALTMMFGQIGGSLGNVLFAVLLDLNCAVPFFFLAILLLGTGLIVYFIPDGKTTEDKELI